VKRSFGIVFSALLLAGALALVAQQPQAPPNAPPPLFKTPPKDNDPNARIVEGSVKDQTDTAIEGAIVKLKDTKTLQVRSFITKTDGKFTFTGLRKDVDYEIRADHKELASPTKTVSVFDSRKVVSLTLKLEPKK